MRQSLRSKLLASATISDADVKEAIKKASPQIKPFLNTITVNKFIKP